MHRFLLLLHILIPESIQIHPILGVCQLHQLTYIMCMVPYAKKLIRHIIVLVMYVTPFFHSTILQIVIEIKRMAPSLISVMKHPATLTVKPVHNNIAFTIYGSCILHRPLAVYYFGVQERQGVGLDGGRWMWYHDKFSSHTILGRKYTLV